ncbi:MAG: hypothetical protein G01um101416_1081 [Microgenomates group bacterium Gr01-1014_16]|nr:MAG: hypothetical protein G01um101416_1081 [Microgenomates group bacterium Gr01-1014_16]
MGFGWPFWGMRDAEAGEVLNGFSEEDIARLVTNANLLDGENNSF